MLKMQMLGFQKTGSKRFCSLRKRSHKSARSQGYLRKIRKAYGKVLFGCKKNPRFLAQCKGNCLLRPPVRKWNDAPLVARVGGDGEDGIFSLLALAPPPITQTVIYVRKKGSKDALALHTKTKCFYIYI